MQPTLAVAAVLQCGAAQCAALAAAAVLLARDPRHRAYAMPAALVLAAAGLGTLVSGSVADDLTDRAGLVAAGSVGALMAITGLGVLLYQRPGWIVPLVFVTLPVRIPVPIGDENAYLLVLLYGVIAAGAVAAVIRVARTPVDRLAVLPAREPRLHRLELALAAAIVLYAAQSLYSSDVEHALKIVCFFGVPFALLFRMLADLEWTKQRVTVAFGVSIGLAVLFAAVGVFEYATKHLLIFNSKVLLSNEIKPYFRVNSLFFDPNIYGRFLALAVVALAGTLLWRRRERDVPLIGLALLLMWAGLIVSLSESSFAALLFGLAVLIAVRWRPGPMLALAGVAVVAAVVVFLISPSAFGVKSRSFHAINEATSGRATLVREGVKMARDRPVFGFGSGSFSEEYRVRRQRRSTRSPAESHTIPVTVAAEQGVIGLAAYLAVVVTAFLLLFDGLGAAARRRGPPGWPDGARMIVAAVFAALFLHTLVYAAFLEDPITWTLLAMGAGLREVARRSRAEQEAQRRDPALAAA